MTELNDFTLRMIGNKIGCDVNISIWGVSENTNTVINHSLQVEYKGVVLFMKVTVPKKSQEDMEWFVVMFRQHLDYFDYLCSLEFSSKHEDYVMSILEYRFSLDVFFASLGMGKEKVKKRLLHHVKKTKENSSGEFIDVYKQCVEELVFKDVVQ